MSKLKFNPNPTFKLDVAIPVAGQEEAGVLTMTFRHLKPDAWQSIFADATAKISAAAGSEDKAYDGEAQLSAMVEAVKGVATGWAWAEEFSDENIRATIENYPAFYATVMREYGEEIWKVRVKS